MDPVQAPSWRPRRRPPPKPPPPTPPPQQHQQHPLQRGRQSQGNRAEGGASQEQHLQPPSKQPRAAIKSFDQLRAENASTSTRAAAPPPAGNAGPAAAPVTGGGPTVLLRRPHQEQPATEKRVQTPPKQSHPLPREGVPDGPQLKVLPAQDQVHRQQRRQKHNDLKQQLHRPEQREARQQWQQQDDARRQAGRPPAKLRPEAQPADGRPASVMETPFAEPIEERPARNVRHAPPTTSTDASSGVRPVHDNKEKESVGSKDDDNEKRRKSKTKKKQSIDEEGGAAQATKDSSSSKKSKKKKKKKKAKSGQEPKTKVVIRRLPAHLPPETFWESVKPWVNDEEIDWKCFIPGKLPTSDRWQRLVMHVAVGNRHLTLSARHLSLDSPTTARLDCSRAKMAAFSRAYIHFKFLEAVLAFHRGYDGHVFEDGSGNASRAVVEFAPFQGIPKEKKKKNQRQGTIDEDPDYLAFLKHFKADPSSALSTVDENENPAPDQKTSVDGKLKPVRGGGRDGEGGEKLLCYSSIICLHEARKRTHHRDRACRLKSTFA
ncbi:MAG: Smg-4/UPF3 family-domain-containing protein [Olpidium bornovanus]|uniref:Smg-4/UPF3 family-domain-containing protein n=1 Tax=Olpidium bornovanus TaxID=278681 RepID=A0A8H7ZLC1_9FUNG|nr:MAG: Smg-4/UPF3 family-domain-containing protein [Olpidium bornovanus]